MKILSEIKCFKLGQFKIKVLNALLMTFALSWSQNLFALPAFPGAEGFGSHTIGGRGGRVIEVTNLNDSGTGSFRAAVTASGPRIVVFKVAGIIILKSQIAIKSPYLTIAGQTSPGGITVKNDPTATGKTPVKVATHDVIIRYLKFRPGPSPLDTGNLDAFDMDGATNVIVDHCSFSWATDEVVTIAVSNDVTIQNSIIAEGLNNATHPEGPHSKGLHIREFGTNNVSIHHNLLAHNYDRNPNITPDGTVTFANNVVYNGTRLTEMKDKFGEPTANIIGNFYKKGPSTAKDKYEVFYYSSTNRKPQVYVKGNIGPHRLNDSLPESDIVNPIDRWMIQAAPFSLPDITITSAAQAYDNVLASAGASFPERDYHDARIVNDVKNGTGKLIDNPSQVNGWLAVSAGVAAPDSDHDGMPDAYEITNNFNPNDPSDANKDYDLDGYSNVEEYLNGLVSASQNSNTSSVSEGASDNASSSTEPSSPTSDTNVESPSAESTITVIVAEDASLRSAYPNSNYGAKKYLQVDKKPTEQFLMKFHVSGIGSRKILKAKLRIYNVNGSDNGGSFYKVQDNSWKESTVTYNTAPAMDASPFANLATVREKKWYEIDVSSMLKADGTYSIRAISNSKNGADYSSKDAGTSLAPRLIITLGD